MGEIIPDAGDIAKAVAGEGARREYKAQASEKSKKKDNKAAAAAQATSAANATKATEANTSRRGRSIRAKGVQDNQSIFTNPLGIGGQAKTIKKSLTGN